MKSDSLKYLRHELRGYLNHIVGYSEILLDDLKEIPESDLSLDIEKIREEALNLQTVFQQSFYLNSSPLEKFDAADFKRNLFGPLYMIIGLAQRLKKLCEDKGSEYLLEDVLKVLDSARKILELIEQEMKSWEAETSSGEDVAAIRFTIGNMSGNQASLKDQNLGRILVVDDNEMNRDILVRHLERQGHQVVAVENGARCLSVLQESTFDLVLLDIMMPGLNGYQVLEKIKGNPKLRDIPVIMISALDEMDSVAHCISLGAEDYLPKSFDPILLKARISACMTKKHYRDQEQHYVQALMETQQHLEKELAEAADYVRGLLPPPSEQKGLSAQWVFQPSAKLGGDCFDFHWLDENSFAVYLLDVAGHGIGAALLSVSVMNVLRSQGLPNTDFKDPAAVLGALNLNFQMENQNNMYFTIWYGVWNNQTRVLRFASAGAPPAILVDEKAQSFELTTTDMIVGVELDYVYEISEFVVPPRSKLYLFSDGVYEIKKTNGKMLVFKEFVDLLTYQAAESQRGNTVKAVRDQIQGISGLDHFDDDFSLLEVEFS
jgi:sigma-B regulation protein RsbU (phosphoserine phosphatase)